MPVNSGMPPARASIQPLGIPLFADRERSVHVDLGAPHLPARENLPGEPAVDAERRDQRHDRHDPGSGKHPGHLGRPTHVLRPVRGTETEIAAEAAPQFIAINDRRQRTGAAEVRLQPGRERGLARAGEPGEPDYPARVTRVRGQMHRPRSQRFAEPRASGKAPPERLHRRRFIPGRPSRLSARPRSGRRAGAVPPSLRRCWR